MRETIALFNADTILSVAGEKRVVLVEIACEIKKKVQLTKTSQDRGVVNLTALWKL
jgi:hypothetical protein